jgi:hypothetical protein
MSDLTPREHALRVAAASVLADIVSSGYEGLRKQAEPAFAKLRKSTGAKTLNAELPDGTELGAISIWAGPPKTTINFAALVAIVINDDPDQYVEELRPEAATDPLLLEFVRDHMPHLLVKKIDDDFLKSLIKKIDANGYLKDAAGTRIKVADVQRGEPTGRFSYKAGPGARELVWEAWQNGTLQPLIGDLLRPEIEAGEAE